MTTFKISRRNNQSYLYVRCTCGSQRRVPELTLAKYMAEAYSRQLSAQVKRGIEAALERGDTIFMPSKHNNSRRSGR